MSDPPQPDDAEDFHVRVTHDPTRFVRVGPAWVRPVSVVGIWPADVDGTVIKFHDGEVVVRVPPDEVATALGIAIDKRAWNKREGGS